MLFSSITFLFYFFPAVLALYYLFRRSYPIKNGVLLIASLFFYAWGEPWFVLIMLASILGNYILALFVDKYREQKRKVKVILLLTVLLNIGLLFVFKYILQATCGAFIASSSNMYNINSPGSPAFFCCSFD